MVKVLTSNSNLFESDREAYENKIKQIFESIKIKQKSLTIWTKNDNWIHNTRQMAIRARGENNKNDKTTKTTKNN